MLQPVRTLALDSRNVVTGSLFAALPGTRAHGLSFLEQAITNGAIALLSDREPDDCNLPVFVSAEPHQTLAQMARRLFPGQPATVVAVTGTNGKSSVVEFLRQIWQLLGSSAAAIGTLGVTRQNGTTDLGYTTPDAIALQRTLAELAKEGISHCAFEASSHGLDQHRSDAVDLAAAGFTNLSQDHFDYHDSFADYYKAKARLFDELIGPDVPCIINVDDQYGKQLATQLEKQDKPVWRIGWEGEQVKLLEIEPRATGQQLSFLWQGKTCKLLLPLVGEFQAANALMACALAISTGADPLKALDALQALTGVRGRMELAATTPTGAPVIVDFAHTPDGLEKLLRTVRPHTKGRVILVFGCGGDRDPRKRPLMGNIAGRLADIAIVTDDNPRSELSGDIRSMIMAACPDALEIADRSKAIAKAISMAKAGDSILIAGKGHEQGQIIGKTTYPFDDAACAQELTGAVL